MSPRLGRLRLVMLIAASAMAACVILPYAAQAAEAAVQACTLSTGQRVLLASTEMDPDVFVWDSKVRMAQYAAGTWSTTREVLVHTLLSKPGTQATILSCEAAAVHSRLSGSIQDAIAVRILSGPNRGRVGWVAGEDVHVLGSYRAAR